MFLFNIRTPADINGERVTLKVTLKSKGQTADDHIHILQDESFKILSGQMTNFLDGEKHYLNVGEEVTLPKNKAHNHYNTDESPAEYIQTISPGIDLDYFLENLFQPLTLSNQCNPQRLTHHPASDQTPSLEMPEVAGAAFTSWDGVEIYEMNIEDPKKTTYP